MPDEDTKLDTALVADVERQSHPPVWAKENSGPISLEPGSVPDGWKTPPREVPAVERLRAFEDEHLGADAVRISGKIERGYGSPFARLKPEQKRQYVALENLIAAEQALADAHAAVLAAEAGHEAALADAEPKPDASE